MELVKGTPSKYQKEQETFFRSFFWGMCTTLLRRLWCFSLSVTLGNCCAGVRESSHILVSGIKDASSFVHLPFSGAGGWDWPWSVAGEGVEPDAIWRSGGGWLPSPEVMPTFRSMEDHLSTGLFNCRIVIELNIRERWKGVSTLEHFVVFFFFFF